MSPLLKWFAGKSLAEKFAIAARGFLILFGVFCCGYGVAQLESVKAVQESAKTGELPDTLLSDINDSYDKKIAMRSFAPNPLRGGAVLVGPEFSRRPVLFLMNEKGILHRWNIDPGLFNPVIKEWWRKLPVDEEYAIDDARLLPNGDVVFIELLMSVNNYRGQRLARMDRDSRILWQVPGNFHHFIEIAGDPQKIYTLTSRLMAGFPEVAPPHKDIRYLEDYIEVYSLDGKKLDEWSIVDAFVNSPYRIWLSSFEISTAVVQRIVQDDKRALYDLLHINSVHYLDAAKAKAIPGGRQGDLLVSFRALDAIAAFRPAAKQIVWAAKGPWRHQHNAQVWEDGKIYMFDNEGQAAVTMYTQEGAPEQFVSRILRFDAFTNITEEIYSSPALYSYFLGDYYRLSTGDWILSSPMHGSAFALSPEKEILWELHTHMGDQRHVPHHKQISFMHYYPAPALLPFAKELKAIAPQ